MKDNYYIENDTLYGKEKRLLSDREQKLERNIALSKIKSIEIETFNWITTSLLVGIIALPIVLIISFLSDPPI